MAELYANDFTTSLTASLDTSATTIYVQDAAPAALQGGTFRIVIGDELLMVTAGEATTTWTVTRGIEGTTAAAHANGVAVAHVLTAAAIAAIGAGTPIASLPAVTVPAATDAFVVDQGGTTKQVAYSQIAAPNLLIATIDPGRNVMTSGTVNGANVACAMAFVVTQPETVSSCLIYPTAQAGNIDIGVYQGPLGGDLTLLTSTGSTACPAINGMRSIAFTTPVVLIPGVVYWIALANDNATFGCRRVASSGENATVKKTVRAQAAAFPLPATFTTNASNGIVPMVILE